MTKTPLTLYTFSVSHFSEKIRWALDFAHVPYTEKPLVPFFHIPTTLRLGGGKFTTVPIVVAGDEKIQDSTRILNWLEANRAPFPLLPKDAEERKTVMELEAQFDRMGAQLIRYAYADVLDNKEGVLTLWTLDANAVQAAVLRLAYPLLKPLFKKNGGITVANVGKAQTMIQEALDLIAARTSAKQPYLVGGAFSAADLTAAALLAPLVCPDEHPVYSLASYREGIAPQVAQWQSHPAFIWVRRMYATHRRN